MTMHPELTKTIVNDPSLTQLVSVKVVRPFCVRGVRQEIGTEVQIERSLAQGLCAVGKAEIID